MGVKLHGLTSNDKIRNEQILGTPRVAHDIIFPRSLENPCFLFGVCQRIQPPVDDYNFENRLHIGCCHCFGAALGSSR